MLQQNQSLDYVQPAPQILLLNNNTALKPQTTMSSAVTTPTATTTFPVEQLQFDVSNAAALNPSNQSASDFGFDDDFSQIAPIIEKKISTIVNETKRPTSHRRSLSQ